jgi:hypothetical protein
VNRAPDFILINLLRHHNSLEKSHGAVHGYLGNVRHGITPVQLRQPLVPGDRHNRHTNCQGRRQSQIILEG